MLLSYLKLNLKSYKIYKFTTLIDPNPIIIPSHTSNTSHITNLNDISSNISNTSSNTTTETSKLSKEKKELLDSMLRVDHAGEYAAVCIYQGQLDILRNSKYDNTLKVYIIRLLFYFILEYEES